MKKKSIHQEVSTFLFVLQISASKNEQISNEAYQTNMSFCFIVVFENDGEANACKWLSTVTSQEQVASCQRTWENSKQPASSGLAVPVVVPVPFIQKHCRQ